MSTLSIIPYTDTYKDKVSPLILKIQTEEFGIPITIKDQPDLLEIPKFYQIKSGNFWLAVDQDRLVGTIALIDIGNNQAALRKMFVESDYRGKEKAVAQSLLNTLFLWCKQRSISEIYLGTTALYHAAHRFYEKNGFQELAKEMLPQTFPVMQVDTKFYVYYLGA